jgi:hypothetical protein
MLASIVAVLTFGVTSTLAAVHADALPSYHYGAPIHVECMNRSS